MITNGIINLNKPPKKTSFQMVALVRKLSEIRKVGHSGTLDPDATGVLPILLGKATKLASFLTESTKVYQAEIEFGTATDTYDSSGSITWQGDPSTLTLAQIQSELAAFHGFIEQKPPMYSAIKYHGKPLYQLARAGIEIDRKSRQVHLFRLEILNWDNPVLALEIECSKGTYIRSLAHDLGQALECGAHLRGLTRTRSGPFHIDDSISASQLEEEFQKGQWETFVHSPDTVLLHLPATTVNAKELACIKYGQSFPPLKEQLDTSEELHRAYSPEGRFIALVKFDRETNQWQPKKVFL
ncbi:MAG: tRNA pseudouridine(55) synthase TruB [Chloroflexota bacterium]|nr:tRNA pseudouridine(55) synthase TruB [Chloroflexota bacterium]